MLSYDGCCAQQARQREIADSATLGNVRDIANRAAAAWGAEAMLAKKREDRALRTAEYKVVMLSNNVAGVDDRLLSENPDRGYASD